MSELKITLEEAFRSNFSMFDGFELDQKNDQIRKINYIETITNALEKDLKGVNLFELFKNENNLITATDTEINEALLQFDRTNFNINIEPIVINELSVDDIKKLADIYKSRFTEQKGRLEGYITSRTRDASSYLSRYHTSMREASDYRNQLENLVIQDSTNLVASVNEIIHDPRFEFLGFIGNNDILRFKLREDVICTHKNRHAGIDMRLNFGKFEFRLNVNNGYELRILRLENNIDRGSYYHPHINSEGQICLGNMTELFEDARSQGNLLQMMEVGYQVITNYNPDSPYVSLADFVEVSDQIQPTGIIRNEDAEREQDHYCPTCDALISITFRPESEGDYMEVECTDCGSYHEYEFCY